MARRDSLSPWLFAARSLTALAALVACGGALAEAPPSPAAILLEQETCRPWLQVGSASCSPIGELGLAQRHGLARAPGFGFLSDPELPWKADERSLVWAYLALAALDVYQTATMPEGFVESNPLVTSWAGDRPDAAELALFKAAATYGILRLADRVGTSHTRRRAALGVINALQLGTSWRNERVTDQPASP